MYLLIPLLSHDAASGFIHISYMKFSNSSTESSYPHFLGLEIYEFFTMQVKYCKTNLKKAFHKHNIIMRYYIQPCNISACLSLNWDSDIRGACHHDSLNYTTLPLFVEADQHAEHIIADDR